MQLITPFQIDLNMTPYFSRIITIFRLYVQFYSRKVLIFIRQSLAIHVLEYIRQRAFGKRTIHGILHAKLKVIKLARKSHFLVGRGRRLCCEGDFILAEEAQRHLTVMSPLLNRFAGFLAGFIELLLFHDYHVTSFEHFTIAILHISPHRDCKIYE